MITESEVPRDNNMQNKLTRVHNASNDNRYEITGNECKTITVSIPAQNIVAVKIFNLGGKDYAAGTHAFTLNTASLAKGVYFYS